MAEITRYIKHKRDTAANWTANNPILYPGQLGIETDGLTTTPKFKIGDGVTVWNSLPYALSGGGSIGGTVSAGAIPVGTALNTIGDSIISQSGTTITVTGNLRVSNLTPANRAMISSAFGQLALSAVTSTELSQLIGVSGNIQGQINSKLSTTLNAAKIIVGDFSNTAQAVYITGEASLSDTGTLTLNNDSVIAKLLTAFASGAGVISSSDSILSAIQKLDGNIAALSLVYQPLDADLTAIAALSTTVYGRALLTLANANSSDWLVKSNNLSDIASTSSARTNIGATTIGSNLFTLTNPSAISYLRVNADNSVTALSLAQIQRELKIPLTYALTQPYTIGAVTTEVVAYSILIPAGTIVTNDLLETYFIANINSSANAKTVRFYFSTANETVGNAPSGSSTLFQTYANSTTAILSMAQLRVRYSVRSNTTIIGWLNATSTSGSPTGNNTVASTLITVPTFANDIYLVVTGQKANSGDTLTIELASLKAIKKQ